MDFLSDTWAILQLLLGFTFIIAVHELGHFLVAKYVGIRCTQFAIGFGQALLCYRKGIGWRVGTTEPELRRRVLERATLENRDLPDQVSETEIHKLADEYGYGETEYRLNWMPLGGYVKMVGQEDLDPTASSADPRSFTQKSIPARLAVISAGVIMNGIFAVIFFILAFSAGVEFPPAIVGYVAPDTPAANTPSVEDPNVIGLQTGDRVVAVDDEPTSDFTSVLIAAPLGNAETPIHFKVERPRLGGDEVDTYTFPVKPLPADDRNALPYVGIGMPSSIVINDEKLLTDAGRERLEKLGLRPGMRISAVNGKPVEEYWQFDRYVQESAGEPVTVAFTDDAGVETAQFTPKTGLVGVDYRFERVNGKKATDQLGAFAGLVPALQAGKPEKGSAAEGKVNKGDVIVAIGGVEWPSLTELIDVVQEAGSDPVTLTLIRDGKRQEVTIEPNRKYGFFGRSKLGLPLGYAEDATGLWIAKVMDDSPFAAAGVKEGTRIDSVNGEPVKSFTDLRLALQKADGDSVELALQLPVRGGTATTETLALTKELRASVDKLRWSIDTPPLLPLRIEQKADGIGEAAAMGFEKTRLFMVHTYITLERLIAGWLKVDNLRGPVGIVAEGKRVTQQGWAYLMFFLGLISINLAVINFLPMPIVDGGLAVLLMLEWIRGKPLSPNVAGAINLVGLLLIGTLFVTLTFYDVARIFIDS